jgi:hypothetical protein
MNLRPLAEGLVERGHRVVAVLRDLSVARRFFPNPAIEIIPAPFKHARIRDIEPTCTFAQILHNCGFGDADELAALANAWRGLYGLIRPDLIIFDHSPTALLASAGLPVRRALIGTGFFSPVDSGAPGLPNLRTWHQADPTELALHEAEVLANMNAALRGWRAPPLDRVAQLYRWLDQDFLMTFRELDTYQRESDAEYWGIWSGGMGEPPRWPPGRGKRIFAYLKPFPALPQLLETLNGLPNPSLVYIPGVDPRLRDQFRNPILRFAAEPVEMGQVARECDVAILNGTHATTVAILLAGKPALHIPIVLEQAINAGAAQRLRAAICAPPSDIKHCVAGLRVLLTGDRLAAGARSFARRYSSFDAARQLARLLDRAEALAIQS